MSRKGQSQVGRRVRLIRLDESRSEPASLVRGALGTVTVDEVGEIVVEFDEGPTTYLTRGVDQWAYVDVPRRLAGVRRGYELALARRRLEAIEKLADERGLVLPEGHGWSGEWRSGELVDVVAVPLPGFPLPLPFGETLS